MLVSISLIACVLSLMLLGTAIESRDEGFFVLGSIFFAMVHIVTLGVLSEFWDTFRALLLINQVHSMDSSSHSHLAMEEERMRAESKGMDIFAKKAFSKTRSKYSCQGACESGSFVDGD